MELARIHIPGFTWRFGFCSIGWDIDSVRLERPPGDSNAAGLMAGVWEPQMFTTGLAEAERTTGMLGIEEGQRQH